MLSLRTVLLACSLASLYQAGVIHEPKSTPNPKDFITAVCDSSSANEKIVAHDCRTAFLAFPFEKNATQLRNHKRTLQSISGTCNITISTTNRHSFEVSAGRLLHGKDVQDKGGLEGVLKQCPEQAGSILIEGGTHHKENGNIELIVSAAVGGAMNPYPTGEESPYPEDGPSSSYPSGGSYPSDGSYPSGGSYPSESYPSSGLPSDPNDPADRPPTDGPPQDSSTWSHEHSNDHSPVSPSPEHSIPANPMPGGKNSIGSSGNSGSPYPDGSSGTPNSTNSSSPDTFKTAQCAKGDELKKLDEEDCRTAFLDLPFDCDTEKLKVNTSSISSTENGCTVVITAIAGKSIEVSSGRLLDGIDGNGGIDALFKQCGDFPGSISIEGGATDETNVKISITSSMVQPLKSQKRHVITDYQSAAPDMYQVGTIMPIGPGPARPLPSSPSAQCNQMQTIVRDDCEKALDLFPFRQGILKSEDSSMSRSVKGCTVQMFATQNRSLSASKTVVLEYGLRQLWETCHDNAGTITVVPDLPDANVINLVVSSNA